jgi:hypothetical protein
MIKHSHFSRTLLAALTVAGIASTAHAHFLWAQIDDKTNTVQVTLAEGASGVTEGVPVKQLAAAHAWAGQVKDLPLKTEGAARSAELPPGAGVAGVAQNWGVLDKTEQGRGIFLLEYGAKAAASLQTASGSVNLPLELFARPDTGTPNGAIVELRHNGKPVPATAITLHAPEDEKGWTLTADDRGLAHFLVNKPGIYGLRAGVVEETPGEFEGKKYPRIRRYATLTFRSEIAVQTVAAAKVDPQAGNPNGNGNPKADPAAYALLRQAHEARLVMPEGFPGFSADVIFTEDGKSFNGTLIYRRKGKTDIEFPSVSEKQKGWIQEKLMNLLGHRRGGDFAQGDGRNPLSFGKEPDNAFGKLIELNDGLGSSYRVNDNKVTEVTRTMGGTRFTISVLETMEADPGKYLAGHFAVAYRDEKTGALMKFEGYRDSYSQFDGVWLPTERIVVEFTEKAAPTMRSLRLKNIKTLAN